MIIGNTNSSFLEDLKEGGKMRHTDYSKMKALGYGSADFQQLSYNKSFLIAEATDAEFEEFLTEEGRLAEANGVIINQLHGPWPVYDEVEENRPKNVEHMKKCVLGAHFLGAKNVVHEP